MHGSQEWFSLIIFIPPHDSYNSSLEFGTMDNVKGGNLAKLEEGTLFKVARSSPSIPKINFVGLLCRSFHVHETALEWSVCNVYCLPVKVDHSQNSLIPIR